MRGAKYRALTAQQIKPEGWLLRQLEIQAEGLMWMYRKNDIKEVK